MPIICLYLEDAGDQRGVDCVIHGRAPGWELTGSEQLSTRECLRESRSEGKDRIA